MAIRALKHVRVPPLPPERFKSILTARQSAELDRTIERAHAALQGRVVWSVNSTLRGGGVAEMLASLIAYARGAGVDSRWAVIRAAPPFFQLTKRLHNRLHGASGDGGPLGRSEHELFTATCERLADEFAAVVRSDDVVILHDPQTAGMTRRLKETGATVVWRSHIGADLVNEMAEEAWRFLLPYVREADAYVFSREAFAWSDLDRSKVAVIPPSIDAFSPKNQEMDDSTAATILRSAGLELGTSSVPPVFARLDGSPSRVDHRVKLADDARLPPDCRVITQVSRWDRLKDPAGVLEAFCSRIAPRSDAHLLLAGPDVQAVADDPEGAEVLREVTVRRSGCGEPLRERIHLASLPMADTEENAAIVNAVQRRSTVVAQKSIAEGFGLTVAEAMWKGRAVVASRVGGIQDQIADGESGVLVDPLDLERFSDAVLWLLERPQLAASMGEQARRHVRERFLGPRHLRQYVELLEALVSAPQPSGAMP